jgi:tRNA-binding EMAP/Myf-like protein
MSDPSTPAAPNIDFAQFMAVDIRIGRIVTAKPLERRIENVNHDMIRIPFD